MSNIAARLGKPPDIVHTVTGEIMEPDREWTAAIAGIAESPVWTAVLANLGGQIPQGLSLFRRYTLGAAQRVAEWTPDSRTQDDAVLSLIHI